VLALTGSKKVRFEVRPFPISGEHFGREWLDLESARLKGTLEFDFWIDSVLSLNFCTSNFNFSF
jgi:hypothetical protein